MQPVYYYHYYSHAGRMQYSSSPLDHMEKPREAPRSSKTEHPQTQNVFS